VAATAERSFAWNGAGETNGLNRFRSLMLKWRMARRETYQLVPDLKERSDVAFELSAKVLQRLHQIESQRF
jgi:hypothetical protein